MLPFAGLLRRVEIKLQFEDCPFGGGFLMWCILKHHESADETS